MSGIDGTTVTGVAALREIREHLEWLRDHAVNGVRSAYPFIVSGEDLCGVLEEMENMVGSTDLKVNVAEKIKLLLFSKGSTNGRMLHTLITGVPGTGKTTWAKLLARAWAALGALKGPVADTFGAFPPLARQGPVSMRTRSRLRSSLGARDVPTQPPPPPSSSSSSSSSSTSSSSSSSSSREETSGNDDGTKPPRRASGGGEQDKKSTNSNREQGGKRLPPPHVTILAPSKMFPMVFLNTDDDAPEDKAVESTDDDGHDGGDEATPPKKTAPQPPAKTSTSSIATPTHSEQKQTLTSPQEDVGDKTPTSVRTSRSSTSTSTSSEDSFIEDGSATDAMRSDPVIATLSDMQSTTANIDFKLGENMEMLGLLIEVLADTPAVRDDAILGDLCARMQEGQRIMRMGLHSIIRTNYSIRVALCFQALFERGLAQITANMYTEGSSATAPSSSSSSSASSPSISKPSANTPPHLIPPTTFQRLPPPPKQDARAERSVTFAASSTSSSSSSPSSSSSASPSASSPPPVIVVVSPVTEKQALSTTQVARGNASKDQKGSASKSPPGPSPPGPSPPGPSPPGPSPSQPPPSRPPSDKGCSKAHFLVVSREDLVAGYVGQTAIKTRKVLDSMRGGVLIIDEAYALKQDEKDWFGQEAINTITLYMSEHADSIVIIFVGYKEETEKMIASNPGLKRRIGWRFHVETYDEHELSKIFLKQCAESGWTCNVDDEKLADLFYQDQEAFTSQGGDTDSFLFQCEIVHAKYHWNVHKSGMETPTTASKDADAVGARIVVGAEDMDSRMDSRMGSHPVKPEDIGVRPDGKLFVHGDYVPAVDMTTTNAPSAEQPTTSDAETTGAMPSKTFSLAILNEAMERHVKRMKKERPPPPPPAPPPPPPWFGEEMSAEVKHAMFT